MHIHFCTILKMSVSKERYLKKNIKNWEGILTHKSWFGNFQSKNDAIRCYLDSLANVISYSG